MKSRILKKDTVLLRLFPGEEIIASLQLFAHNYQNMFINFTGIGAINQATLGCFDIKSKNYIKKELTDNYEVVSLIGNIATVNNNPFIHSHICLSNDKFEVVGGHLMSATVSITTEITLSITDQTVARVEDKETGLQLLELEDHGSHQSI